MKGQYGPFFLWQAGNQLGEGFYCHTPQVTRRVCELVVSESALAKYVRLSGSLGAAAEELATGHRPLQTKRSELRHQSPQGGNLRDPSRVNLRGQPRNMLAAAIA